MQRINITIKSQNFTLNPSKTIYWKQQKALLIADVHLGKITHFRKHGSAIPETFIETNFKKLNDVINHFKPITIYFLGDLFHSTLNNEWNYFKDWIKNTTAKITLISGNHDIIPDLLFEELGIEVVSEKTIGQFLLTHHPEERESYFNFCGHIHPSIQIKGSGKQKLKLPCFHKTENQLILPAFGVFTGLYELQINKETAAYVIADSEVIFVKS